MYNLKNSKQDEFFVRFDYFNQQNVFLRSGLQFQKIKQAKMFAKQQASYVDAYLSFTSCNFSLKNLTFLTLSETILKKFKSQPRGRGRRVIIFIKVLHAVIFH